MQHLTVCQDVIKMAQAIFGLTLENGKLSNPFILELKASTNNGDPYGPVARLFGREVTDDFVTWCDKLMDDADKATEILSNTGEVQEGVYILHGGKGYILATPEELEELQKA